MLNIKKLLFNYKGSEPLFAGLSLDIEAGKIYGLLGKNGVGKTTLLKIMTGLLFPESGSCKMLNTDTSLRLPEILREIYFIAEEFYVPNVTAEEYIKYYSPFYPNFDPKVFKHAANEFELVFDKKLTKLSYGQKKKFLVAFGLATSCKLLLLDEPTNGLDIPSKSQFRKLLASALTEDKTIVIATHQVRDLEHLIDTVVILEDGQIIFNKELYDTEMNLENLFCEVIKTKGQTGSKS